MVEHKSNQVSFFGDYLYDQIIAPDHFLKKLAEAVDFSFVNKLCKTLYSDIGRPGILPEKMLKIVLLQYLYKVSDRQIIDEVRYNIAFKWFVGLEITQEPPDASSLTHFRDRLGAKQFAKIFNRIVTLARKQGLIADELSIVDTTAVQAKIDTFRMHDKAPKDPDATHGYQRKNKPFFGYKAHAALDAESHLITKIDVTPAHVHEGTHFKALVDPNVQMITADKAYDTTANHTYLRRKYIESAILIKKNRIDKAIVKQARLKRVQRAQRHRPRIEPKFAELRNAHGLVKARYWGVTKVYIQCCLTAIVVNLKRMVRLLYGVSLCNPPGLVCPK